jgi:hypothetical protein
MCHDDALSFGDCPIDTYEFAVFPHGVDLIQSELVLYRECAIKISDALHRWVLNPRARDHGSWHITTDVQVVLPISAHDQPATGDGDTYRV